MPYAAPPTKSPGDLITSALWNTYVEGNADSGFMRMIADTTLGSSQASVTFSSIPQTFAHLLVVAHVLQSTGSDSWLTLKPNNDTTVANYDSVLAEASATAWAVSRATAVGYGYVFKTRSGNPSGGSVLLPDYQSTSSRAWQGNGYAGNDLTLGGSRWAGAAAITSLVLGLESGGSMDAGTRFTLLGIPH